MRLSAWSSDVGSSDLAAKSSPHRPLPHFLFREYSRHMTDTLLPAQLVDAARKVLDANRAAGRRIAVAESCTGGLVAAALTEIAGSSDVFDTGLVPYSKE